MRAGVSSAVFGFLGVGSPMYRVVLATPLVGQLWLVVVLVRVDGPHQVLFQYQGPIPVADPGACGISAGGGCGTAHPGWLR